MPLMVLKLKLEFNEKGVKQYTSYPLFVKTTATLQNVEYRKPLTVWGELWIILEKICVPLQAALLALAIRRKFMR
jgi:hypothetical protein